MDNVTHTLFGATLARTPLARAGRGTTAALLLASNAPDTDILATAGGTMKYLQWHRGPTHGPLGLVFLSAITATLVWIGRRLYDSRRDAPRPRPGSADDGTRHDASFAMLVIVSMIGIVFHIIMDVPTSYGTRLLSPFSWRWYAVDWMPIVDVYLLMVLVASLFGRASESQRRTRAAIVLALMAANYGLRGMAHYQALDVAPRLFGPTLPELCDPPPEEGSRLESWPRLTPPSPPAPGRRCLVELAAMPSFFSPFRWRIIAQLSNAYEIHDIDLLDSRFRNPESESEAPWRLTLRYPNVWTPAVDRAATTPLGKAFLGFSRFPAARTAIDAHGIATVRWSDMRFAGGVAGLEQPTRSVNPFTAVVRIDPTGKILEERVTR
ncbi:MAG TPA: metal-dependent hydrolase [Vicinamibacterales bacterium]|nr:metal-dependent hydrolase [Vicinamibacterales bacterium]